MENGLATFFHSNSQSELLKEDIQRTFQSMPLPYLPALQKHLNNDEHSTLNLDGMHVSYKEMLHHTFNCTFWQLNSLAALKEGTASKSR